MRYALLVLLALGCGRDEPPPEPERVPLQGEADRRTDRGYRPTQSGLPVVAWEDREWMGEGGERPLDELFGIPVLVEGRMALDESSPYRREFRLVHDYDGCVFPDHREHPEDLIHVRLPEGESIQVTDKPLRVEGVLTLTREPDGAPRLSLKAVAAEPLLHIERRRIDQ